MPGYGGTNGPDGSKKTGDQGGGTRDAAGGQTGGKKGGGGGGKSPSGKTPTLAETARQVYDAPAGPAPGTGDPLGGGYDANRSPGGAAAPQGRQVYSSPIGPDQTTGDPQGYAEHHFSEPTDSTLDSLGGYQTYGDRYAAYQNNPSAPPNQAYDGWVPSFPNATPGYVAGKLFDTLTGLTPAGLVNTAFTGLNGAFTGDYDGMATEMAKAMGASRGAQGPDVRGGGIDRGGGGQAIKSDGSTELSSDASTLDRSPMAQAMETLLEYTSGGTTPTKKQAPVVQQPGVQSPFPSGSSQVVA